MSITLIYGVTGWKIKITLFFMETYEFRRFRYISDMHILSIHTQLSSGVKCLNLSLSFSLPFIVCASREGSGEAMHGRSLL